MWAPNYTIRPRLLRIIREIGEALGSIRAGQLNEPKRQWLTLEARALSSYASTSIEGNPLPLTDVKRLLKNAPGQIVDTEREVLNYNRALQWLHSEVREGRFTLSADYFARIQGMIVDGLLDNPFDVGHLRQKPVVIRDPRAHDEIVFIPPDHRDVPRLLGDLMDFVRANLRELDPVLLAGLFHKQAVIIHPFMDGNGRSTRLMTSAILGMAGLDILPIFSFETYYNRNVTRYFQMVGEQGDFYDQQSGYDLSNWLEYFAEGILDELKRVQKSLSDRPIRLAPHEHLILDYLAQHGSITQREYGAVSRRSLAARKKDFARLIERGLIRSEGGGRSTCYVLSDDAVQTISPRDVAARTRSETARTVPGR